MRRLPVYFLIDVSESMVGAPIREVTDGMRSVIKELRSDPYALETVFLSIIIFAGSAEVLSPLTELYAFTPPAFPIGSGTALGKGLDLLMHKLDAEVRKSTPEVRGDWKPVIFLFTDGAATDDPLKSIEKWREKYNKHCNLIIITFGESADIAMLEKTGGQVLTLTDLSDQSFKEFFKWISASISVNSQAVQNNNQDSDIPLRSCINLEKAQASGHLDENWIILPGKCAKTKTTYLIKYYPNPEAANERPKKGTPPYLLDGAYAVETEAYNRLGGKSGSKFNVNSNLLTDIPPCPVCNNSTAIVQCNKCSQLFCGQPNADCECPWCGNKGRIEAADNLRLNRGQG